MASRALWQLQRVVIHGSYPVSASLRIQQKVLRQHPLLCLGKQHYCTVRGSAIPTDITSEIQVKYEHGLPVFTVPLPSRRELYQFTLKPVTNDVGDFMKFLLEEDGGIDRVAVYKLDGTRIARSTPVDVLMQSDFAVVINDEKYLVKPPAIGLKTSEHATDISDVKNLIAQLHSSLNIEQHQIDREKELQRRLEELRIQIQPYEKILLDLEDRAHRRTTYLSWFGLGLMGLQFGILARLTWWEYSWDIMEPVTYFVTYGTTMAMYAYYVTTKQEYNFEAVRDRHFLLYLHKHAKKNDLSVDLYNKLKYNIAQTEYDLQRLRDPLSLHLPIQQLLPEKKQPQQ